MSEFKGPYGTIFMRRIPKLLRDRFKAACAFRGRNMKQVLMAFMEEYAKDTAKIKKRDVAAYKPRKKK